VKDFLRYTVERLFVVSRKVRLSIKFCFDDQFVARA
jgi:hypothetical protein